MIAPTWSLRRLHVLGEAQIDQLAITDGEAARLYESLGRERVGVISGYALMPQGALCSKTVYYRNLGGRFQHPPHTGVIMCRNIKTLFNFEPPATEAEVRDASLQFARKLCGFSVPSKANEAAFDRAIEEIAASARALIEALVTTAEPRNRAVEAARARARAAERFGTRT